MNKEQNLVIPLVEEHVSTSKREVETGRVRVETRVEERQQLVREQLARDEVEVERVPIGAEIDAMPDVREEDGATIIPVVEEVLVLEKKLVLVEEIRLRRRRVSETFERPVTLRSQRAEISRDGPDGQPNPTNTTPTQEIEQ